MEKEEETFSSIKVEEEASFSTLIGVEEAEVELEEEASSLAIEVRKEGRRPPS